MRKCIYAYVWDFIDEGLDNVLERIRHLGIDAVAVAVSYHAGKFILPHNPNAKVYFPEDGTVYFTPRTKYYPGIIRPAVASILNSSDVLSAIDRKCEEYGIKLHAWTVCMHNTRLGSKHPEFTVRNVFGDQYPYSLCPAQPEVAEYALGLISDLADNYNLDTIFLESLGYMGFSHGYHHEFFGVKLHPSADALLSLCFCDRCVAEAKKTGIDIDRVKKICEYHITESIENSPDRSEYELQELTGLHPELAAYIEMRFGIVTGLYKRTRIIADNNNTKIDYFGPVFQSSCNDAFIEGINREKIAPLIDHYVIPVGTPDLNAVTSDINNIKDFIRPEKIVLSINLGISATPTRENFNQKMALIQEHKLAGCNLYNYSTLPFSRLEWIKDQE